MKHESGFVEVVSSLFDLHHHFYQIPNLKHFTSYFKYLQSCPDVPLNVKPALFQSKCFIFSCTHAPAYVQKGSGLQQRSWLVVDLENELHNTYGKSKTACNRRLLGGRPFALKETRSSSLPLNSLAILAHYIYSLMFG